MASLPGSSWKSDHGAAESSLYSPPFESDLPSPSFPQPFGNLQSNVPPPFLTKTYDMVDDLNTNSVVSWSSGCNSFVVWDPPEFSQRLLPRYFKHNNFSSFVRQLNTYGFRKVDPDRWEFANEGFLRGHRHLLKGIHRRKPVSQVQTHQLTHETTSMGPCIEVGSFGLEGEIERLKRDKNVLTVELVRLRQQQQSTEQALQTMGQRLQLTEQRQQQMMAFLAKAMQNSVFLAQLIHQSEIDNGTKKRRLQPPNAENDAGTQASDFSEEGQLVTYYAGPKDHLRASAIQFYQNDPSMNESLSANSLEVQTLSDAKSRIAKGTADSGEINVAQEMTYRIVCEITSHADAQDLSLTSPHLDMTEALSVRHEREPLESEDRLRFLQSFAPREGINDLLELDMDLNSAFQVNVEDTTASGTNLTSDRFWEQLPDWNGDFRSR